MNPFMLIWNDLRQIHREAGFGGLVKSTRMFVFRPLRWWRADIQRILALTKNQNGYLEIRMGDGTLLVHAADIGISRELYVYGNHEPEATACIKEFLREGMTVIDIGANIGYYVLVEKQMIGEAGRVIAVEPVPRNLMLLKRNIERNSLSNVEVIEGAVGDRDGKGFLYLSDRSNLHSMLPSLQTQGERAEVDLITVDTLVDVLEIPRVDFVRMDIEGGEVLAVKGMVDTLRRHKPALMIEIHPPWAGGRDTVEMLRVLRSLGYNARVIIDRTLDYERITRGGRARGGPLTIDELIQDDRVSGLAWGFLTAVLTQ